jgi:hypothetical protein
MQDASLGVERLDRLEPGPQEGLEFGRQLGTGHPSDPFAPLAGLLRFGRRQVVEPDARMCVDDPERLVLALEIGDDLGQHRVLEHIGEIARVIAVTVIHRLA